MDFSCSYKHTRIISFLSLTSIKTQNPTDHYHEIVVESYGWEGQKKKIGWLEDFKYEFLVNTL
jgi:predicted 3-demethylubiquinone-9 3-methyltransferase (glyoxalase superfamily)